MKGKKYVYDPATKKMVPWTNPNEIQLIEGVSQVADHGAAFVRSMSQLLSAATVKGKR